MIKNNQKGNALFLILIAVILFAALAYAVSKSEGGNAGTVSSEQLSIRYAQHQQMLIGMSSAIQKMAVIGCRSSDSYIGWDPNQALPTGVRSDCILFNTFGGPVPAPDPAFLLNNNIYITDSFIDGTVTNNADTVVSIIFEAGSGGNPNTEIFQRGLAFCNYINQKNAINVTVDENQDDFVEGSTSSVFFSGENLIGASSGNTPAPYWGKAEGCFYSGNTFSSFVHYLIVIER